MMLLSQCSLYLIIILFLYSLLIFLLVAVGVVWCMSEEEADFRGASTIRLPLSSICILGWVYVQGFC